MELTNSIKKAVVSSFLLGSIISGCAGPVAEADPLVGTTWTAFDGTKFTIEPDTDYEIDPDGMAIFVDGETYYSEDSEVGQYLAELEALSKLSKEIDEQLQGTWVMTDGTETMTFIAPNTMELTTTYSTNFGAQKTAKWIGNYRVTEDCGFKFFLDIVQNKDDWSESSWHYDVLKGYTDDPNEALDDAAMYYISDGTFIFAKNIYNKR